MTESKTVTVYVRAPDDDTRTLSFTRIPEVSDADALKHGFAIDGNSYVMGLTAYFDEDENRKVSLHEGLRDTQQELITWLGALGFTVEFN